MSIVADGAVQPRQTVTNGKIQLSTPARIVHVGLSYESDMQTLPMYAQLQDGSLGKAHQKNVRKVALNVINSQGILVGWSFDKLVEYRSRSTEMPGNAPDLISDEVRIQVTPAWQTYGQVCVRQSQPLPLRITSMTIDVELA